MQTPFSQAPLNLFNPAQAWLQATLEATNAFVSMAAKAADASAAAWAVPATTGQRSTASDTGARSSFPSPAIFRPAAEPPRASPRAPASWYRPPYRSPFDPMFWMMPGHPVDHMQDWLKFMPGAAGFAANSFARPFDACMPQLAAMREAVTQGFAPDPRASFAAPGFEPSAFVSPDAWLAPWKAMFQTFADSPRYDPPSARRTAEENIIDFGSAYSTYRSAGGHAVAQVVQAGRTSPPEQRLQEAPPTVFDMFRWFMK